MSKYGLNTLCTKFDAFITKCKKIWLKRCTALGTNGVPRSVMSFKSLVELDPEVDSGDNEVEETNNFGSFS